MRCINPITQSPQNTLANQLYDPCHQAIPLFFFPFQGLLNTVAWPVCKEPNRLSFREAVRISQIPHLMIP